MFISGVESVNVDLDTLDPRDKHLIILDDLMDETEKRVASLFTKKSHHRNISVHRSESVSSRQISSSCLMVFNATFSNISAILWRPVLVVEEAGVPGENHRS